MLSATLAPDLVPAAECSRRGVWFIWHFHCSRPPFRANTMGTALEVLGLALPYSSGIPAAYPGLWIPNLWENVGLTLQ